MRHSWPFATPASARANSRRPHRTDTAAHGRAWYRVVLSGVIDPHRYGPGCARAVRRRALHPRHRPLRVLGPARKPPTTVRDDLPALLVNATGDPRTPGAGATVTHRACPGSRPVTVTSRARPTGPPARRGSPAEGGGTASATTLSALRHG
ncbi:alpha/beta hydrolase [Streptomyces sp. NPDC057690]|uniref:alpha/beta hydrolase n=1 Tax=Streptomyces sp. NPDC057690 TaxID=3346214 RepID=UPI00367410B7